MRTDFARLLAICLSLAAGRVAAADWHLWTVMETRHVLRSERPGAGVAVTVAAARNEWVSFQMLVRSDEPIQALRVEPGELHGPGAAVLQALQTRLYRQHQLHLEVGTYRNDAFKPDWYPDPLIPFGHSAGGKQLEAARLVAVPFDLPANETHGFWVDLHVPADTPPGEYRGTYHVTADGGKSVEVPVVLTVWGFTLPQTPTLVTAFGSPAQRMRDISRQRPRAGKEPEPSDWQTVETQCAQLLSEHRFNATPPAEILRPVAQRDGSFQIPSEQVQALRRFVDRYHVNALQVPHPSGVIKDPQAERDKLWAWLAAFDRAAKELARPHIVFFVYLKDEPNTREDYEYVQKWGRAIREAKSVVQVMVVEQTWTEPGKGGADSAWGDLYGAVDIWCPLFSLHRQDSAARRQALGETVWTYTALCQGPPTPWWHIDYPLLNYRVPAWMAWRDHIKGLLYWGGMSYWRETDDPWLHAPVYTGRGALQQGDRGIRFTGEGSLVYPARPVGDHGIVPTIRLKALRDAIEDYEYLVMLDRLGKSAEVDKIVRRLTESWFQWDRDPAAYEKARTEIAAMIVAADSPSRRVDGTSGREAPSRFVISRFTNTHPTDVAKSHVEEITAVTGATHQYTVFQGGTMDGRNCRSPMGCGIAREGAFFQSWESNRSVRVENVGDVDVVNPWLSNGRNNFRSVEDIVSSAVSPGMTDADKAFALWFQEIRYRHHSPGDNSELGDPVKVFNVYGYNTCGNDSICLATLWRQAGLKVAPARALGHCISQAFYDGGWHFYDGDMHSVYLLRDNQTVAGEQAIVRDHDLIKRTHSKGILFPDTWWSEPEMCSMYFFEGPVAGERSGKSDTTMDMVLRPGEALVWRWGQLRPLKYHGMLRVTPTYEDAIYNGLWEYRPDFSKAVWRRGAAVVENITMGPDGLAADEGKTGTVVWSMCSPYVFVGGRLDVEGVGARFFICQDGKTWRPAQDNLDKFFSIVGPACYEYQLKCQLEGPTRLRRLAIISDVQMAPLALPEMVVGENVFTYSDRSTGNRKVRITHNWVERSASRPPQPPADAVWPRDDGEANGTDVVFQWTASSDPDGDAIADYHFELSGRADMKWPLSMSFYKLISRTADATRRKDKTSGAETTTVKAQYTLPQPGLLTPDRTYYWHVRAQDDKGVWGPWSKTWSFTPRGPAHPLDVTVDCDQAKGVGTLRWQANPVGRTPVKYRVYGSDEKGFTIADQRHQSVVGVTKEPMADWNPWFPANFIAETAAAELAVLGADVDLPAANKTYYRVVAVDEQGNRSGPSDYGVAPRPVVHSKPVPAARVGAEYRYQVLVNRSLGDLSARMADDRQTSGYFDLEKPRFTLTQGPAWLTINEATGVLSGTPDVPGRADIVVTVTIDRQVRKLDEAVLRWGGEKVLAVETQWIGAATQKFAIDVMEQEH